MPRWLHRFYAWAFGYFWLPCPACGRMFGGHEALIVLPTYDRALCPKHEVIECVEDNKVKQTVITL
jgi:hypothetical protein